VTTDLWRLSGEFEIHLTLHDPHGSAARTVAEREGVKYTHIVLDRGLYPSQPMLSLTVSGTYAEVSARLGELRRWLVVGNRPVPVARTKIEVPPWTPGVPGTDAEAADDPDERYFEHHVKLLLPDASLERRLAVTRLVEPHDARLSRNARRTRDDGRDERFVTQRCRRVGRDTAGARLDALLVALRAAGHEIVEVEREYVVHDSSLGTDLGWFEDLTRSMSPAEDAARSAPAGAPGYPSTYQPVPPQAGVRQRAAFDPALKQFPRAYRPGEPEFADAAVGRRWRSVRGAALDHVLRAVATAPVARNLVLRGGVPFVWSLLP
jgi:hypothetical protein